METDKKLQGVHHSRFPPLNGEHGEVIALLGTAHEVGHSLHHTLDERTGLLGGGLYHLQDPFLAKQLAVGILGLIESVGIEEERTAWGKIGLLSHELPIG